MFWLALVIFATLLIWLITTWSVNEREEMVESHPQMQVTNRQFSLFLWQNPQFMRQNIQKKAEYLIAWGDHLTVDPTKADDWVLAPSEALFLYFTWQRLVGNYYYPRPILQKEFVTFLNSDTQWHPKYWKMAPEAYKELIQWIEEGSELGDLKEVSYKELPLVVRQAFQGWKNFTKESEAINEVRPTYRQLWTFLEHYPNFRRPLWINLLRETRPDYLMEVSVKGGDLVPDTELDGLIKIGLYNYLLGTAQKPSS